MYLCNMIGFDQEYLFFPLLNANIYCRMDFTSTFIRVLGDKEGPSIDSTDALNNVARSLRKAGVIRKLSNRIIT